VLASALLLCTASILAVNDARAGDFSRAGGYFGINGAWGSSMLTDEVIDIVGGPSGLVSFGDSGGLNTRLGARFWKIVALEAQYEWMHGISASVLGVPIGTYKPHTLTANLKLYLPISRFQPYLLGGAGVGFWKFESIYPGIPTIDTTGFAGRVGLGLDLYLTEKIVLNFESAGVLNTANFDFQSINVIQENLFYLSISGGLIYRF
jgi:hypothetical protein